ncbi:MAG: hypothetical protein M1820_006516 [Bogoriella megaspora]|nr:MAG: hypothetical protein M1820_006516 [Bogoriella megaspora]
MPTRIFDGRVDLSPACDLCGIVRMEYKCTKLYADGQYSAELVPPGLIQLRHFDGATYFWDIGDHLLLQDCKTQNSDPNLPKADADDNSDVIPLEDLVLPDQTSKQRYSGFYKSLSLDYLSGDIVVKPLQVWQDGDRTATLFEKRDSIRPQIRRTQPEACLNCGCLKEHKALWAQGNKGLVQLLQRFGCDRWYWSIGSKVFMKEIEYSTRTGAEEAAVNFIREHTTIPVPRWIRTWHEGSQAITLADRMPGVDYDFAVYEKDTNNKPILSKEDREVIEQEITGYVRQLRALTSSRSGTADGRLLRNHPFWIWVAEAHWPLLPTHEEAKEDWYNKSLSGVSQEDLPELDRLRDTFPNSEPYTFTHGDLGHQNIMVHEKHVWWEVAASRLWIPEILPRETSPGDWMHAWNQIFIPSWKRALDLSRCFRNGPNPNDPESAKRFERLNQKPIHPPLPPYPMAMKEMAAPRRHLDEEGNWQERERLPPMFTLPEFDVSRCRVQ